MRIVEFENFARDERRIEAVAERIDAYRGDDEPQHARLLAARESDQCRGRTRRERDAHPQEVAAFHPNGFALRLGAAKRRGVPRSARGVSEMRNAAPNWIVQELEWGF